MEFVQEQVAPVVAAALGRIEGGLPLRPLMTRALHMGDELHSRNTAAALLVLRELAPPLIELAALRDPSLPPEQVSSALESVTVRDQCCCWSPSCPRHPPAPAFCRPITTSFCGWRWRRPRPPPTALTG